MLGAGEELWVLHSVMPCLACVTFCGSITSWTLLLTVLILQQTSCIVFSLTFACISLSHRSGPPPAPFLRKGSVLICGAISFTSIWLGSWTGAILLSEADSSEKTSPNHISSGFGWQILEFDPEGPAFVIRTIIHPMILLCVQQSII